MIAEGGGEPEPVGEPGLGEEFDVDRVLPVPEQADHGGRGDAQGGLGPPSHNRLR